jgi:hypothetical protein
MESNIFTADLPHPKGVGSAESTEMQIPISVVASSTLANFELRSRLIPYKFDE